MFGCGRGGIEQAIVDYCEALRHSGHEPVAIVHPRAEMLGSLKALGISVHTLPNLGAWDPFAIFRLKRLLKRLAPDICIAHGNRAVSLLKAARARMTVGVMHNYKINCEVMDFVFYPTQDLLRHVRAKNIKPEYFYCVPNMVRVARDAPARLRHSPPVVGAMGRFVSKKGFALFIEALAELKARGVAFRAILAGDGEEASQLKALSQERGLQDILKFTGWVDDKQAFFDAVDIFCLPSSHEPFGIVLLEAMAQALPVVATDSEGPSEIIHSGVDGMLVAKNDPVLLAEALASLLSDRQHADLLARNAYDTVKNIYALEVVAHKLDLALQSIRRL